MDIGCELLDCYISVKHFLYFGEGHHMVIYTDHKPLLSATQRNSSRFTDRETRQLGYLRQFNLEFRHIPGRKNVVADTLSQAKQMAAEQKKCDSDPNVVEFAHDANGTTILCNISTNKTRPISSDSFQRQAFDPIQSLSYPWCSNTH